MKEQIRKTIETIYTRYAPPLQRRALLILGDNAEAEEAVQETFVKLIWEYERGRLDPSMVKLAWLYRVLVNHCLNIRRKLKPVVCSDEYIALCQAEERNVDLMLSLSRLIRSLPAKLHELAIFHYIDAMTIEEMSALTGLSRRTILRRLQHLKEWMMRHARQLAD